jgi:hypothetical protein
MGLEQPANNTKNAGRTNIFFIKTSFLKNRAVSKPEILEPL